MFLNTKDNMANMSNFKEICIQKMNLYCVLEIIAVVHKLIGKFFI